MKCTLCCLYHLYFIFSRFPLLREEDTLFSAEVPPEPEICDILSVAKMVFVTLFVVSISTKHGREGVEPGAKIRVAFNHNPSMPQVAKSPV